MKKIIFTILMFILSSSNIYADTNNGWVNIIQVIGDAGNRSLAIITDTTAPPCGIFYIETTNPGYDTVRDIALKGISSNFKVYMHAEAVPNSSNCKILSLSVAL